jgi:acyl-CoA hydrolase
MSRSQDLYRARLTTAAEAVTAVPRTCNVVLGAFSAQPPALMQALVERVRARMTTSACTIWHPRRPWETRCCSMT